jgi:hypothetical protein
MSDAPDEFYLREELGYLLAAFFSANRMPCMSGDPRDRLNHFQRREMEDAITSILRAGFTKPPVTPDPPRPIVGIEET